MRPDADERWSMTEAVSIIMSSVPAPGSLQGYDSGKRSHRCRVPLQPRSMPRELHPGLFRMRVPGNMTHAETRYPVIISPGTVMIFLQDGTNQARMTATIPPGLCDYSHAQSGASGSCSSFLAASHKETIPADRRAAAVVPCSRKSGSAPPNRSSGP